MPLGVLTLTSGTAAAHAELVSSNPSADAILPVTPSEIVLTFTESVNTVPDSIRVVTSDGADVDVGTIRQDEGDDSIAADLPALADGSYVVAWRAVSVDSHPISGAFTFSVGEATSTDPGLVASLLAGTKPSGGSERWLGIGRWASFLGITAMIGIAAALSLLAPQLLLGRRAGRVLLGCAAVAAVGTAVMIAAQASIAVGDWTAWGEVYDSSAGRWWVIRLAFVAFAVVPIVARRRVAALGWWPTAMAVYVGCLLAVVAQGGHGAAGQHPTAGLIATVVHLAAMSMWVGGLAAIALVAPRRRIVSLATEFSQIALWSVVVLAASGLFNSWRQVGSWDRLTDSDYGTWLIVKLTVLGAVLAVAATSRWLVTHPDLPRLPSSHPRRRRSLTVVAMRRRTTAPGSRESIHRSTS